MNATPRSVGARLGRLVVLGGLVLITPAIASATCYYPGLINPDDGYPLNAPNEYAEFDVSAPYWVAIGAIPNDPGNDYDLEVFSHPTGGIDPICESGGLATSTNNAGRADFIVGDFNHNPFGNYYAWIRCFSGPCDNAPRGIYAWRSGGLITVNAAAINHSIPPNSDFQNQIVNIEDVYLAAGTTYYFQFSQSGDLSMKLMLFRNAGGGTYWTGRNGAVFEVTGCTTYTAPSTGYYGVVVASDLRSANPASYVLGVTTSQVCNCPNTLASDVPLNIAAGAAASYDLDTQPALVNYWQAVGIRPTSPSDWDIYLGTTDGGPPNQGCINANLVGSTGGVGYVDVLAGDFNHDIANLPEAFAVRGARFSGADGATIELDGGPDQLIMNGPRTYQSMSFDDVVRIWDVNLKQDTTYTFSLSQSASDMTLALFRNPTSSLGWYGRGADVFETNTSGTYKPPSDGFYGLALIKNDNQFNTYSLSGGFCTTPVQLSSKTPTANVYTQYDWFDQPAGHWTAVGVYAQNTDWDIRQYDQGPGSAWPDCFGSPGALSNGAGYMDFIVGDFRFNPAGHQYVRGYQYTPETLEGSFVEWDSGSGALQVNAAPIAVTLSSNSPAADRLWCYEVFLNGSQTYTFDFNRTGNADTKMLLFRNPANGIYWAPRSAELLQITSPQSYTTPAGGWYAVVVVKDNDGTGTFSLDVTGPSVAVGPGTEPRIDGLRTIGPNPSHGNVRIGFELARAASPTFEMLDPQGRMVAKLDAGSYGAGQWDVAWNPRAGVQSLASGVYWVRMRLDGRTLDTRRLALVP